MFRKNYFVFAALAALFLLGSVNVFAQSSLKGKVELTQTDGTIVPVAGAMVVIYQTEGTMDKFKSVTTDDKGLFMADAIPVGKTETKITISRPKEPTEWIEF